MKAYEEVGQIGRAAAEAGITHTLHYAWLKSDPEYVARFEALEAEVGAKGREAWRESLKGPRGSITTGPRYERMQVQKVAFLEALSVLGTVRDAAEYVGIGSGQPSKWGRGDPVFAAEVARIQAETTDIARARVSEQRSKAGRAAWTDKEKRAEWAHHQRESWTPERRAEQSRVVRERLASPEARASRSDSARRAQARPEVKRRHSESMKRAWADPVKREAWLTSLRSEERRATASKKAKAQWAVKTPEERKARMKAARRHFKGGHGLSQLEATVIQWLGEHDVPVIPHKGLGDYVLDIYVPLHRLDIEADGERWHGGGAEEREAERDAWIAAQGITVLRLSEAEIQAGDFSRLYEALEV